MPQRNEQTVGVGIFLKFPEPGRVKTRIAQTTGAERAAKIYDQMVNHVLDHAIVPLARDRFKPTLFFDPFRAESDYSAWQASRRWPWIAQEGVDLGARMLSAMRRLLIENGAAILIGTDCVELKTVHLERAVEGLDAGSDVAIGPAEDGGYYLIGSRRPFPTLFESMTWSTDTVMEETLRRAERARLRVMQLPALGDIDTAADLDRHPWLIEMSR